mmetsp:Transcript_12615/g.18264  ORF Transcript_12615/g.18264 Transcript_12615/m.18264 type:complete len:83 (-) Transcript_12615:24-272(-)
MATNVPLGDFGVHLLASCAEVQGPRTPCTTQPPAFALPSFSIFGTDREVEYEVPLAVATEIVYESDAPTVQRLADLAVSNLK